MDMFNEHNDRILKYLRGELNPDDRQRFIEELKINPELNEQLKELSLLKIGVLVDDQIHKGHIDSETITSFAEDSSQLDRATIEEVESHLKSCSDCAEELKLAQKTFSAFEATPEVVTKSIFERISEFLFAPRWVFKPIYSAILLLLLAIPVFLAVPLMTQHDGDQAVYTIAMGTRDFGGENNIVLKRDMRTVKIEFTVPTLDNAIYDFQLFDSGRKKRLTRHNNPADKPFAFVIPTVYLNEGKYTLKVIEFVDGVKKDSQELVFNISFAD